MTTTTSPAPSASPIAGRAAARSSRPTLQHAPVSGRLGHGTGFWVVAGAFLVTMAFSTLPTPLYPLYQARDGFATTMVTVIFAAYAVGVMAALYLVGHVSDWVGRKPVLVAALATELVAAGLFLAWKDTAGLIVARLVCGLGVGALTATATAHLGELGDRSGRARTAGTVATVVNTGGLALGPLVGGILAQYVAGPLVTPHVVFGVLLAAALVGVALVPETAVLPDPRPSYRPQRVSLPREARRPFAVAAAGAAASFSVIGVFTSLTASFVSGTLHVASHLAAGAIVFGVLGAGALAQLALVRVRPCAQLVLGGSLMVAGLAVVAVSGPALSLVLFVVGGVLAGAGQGLVFRSTIGVAVASSAPENRGEVLAAMFLAAYAGLTVPVVAVGVALAHFGAPSVLCVFALVVLVAVAASCALMLRRR
ncbi:MFS transporter [Luteimicrobium album]|uniref:MFS transporter n=1 Tax=Luteimicrobium album TaxID=1054550 RepID=A0ABQ6I8D1_9MICO|nr:MFS transporter [Luteimicrobium album]GMA26566.1 MFS transporter [Luteimicrobium album]